MYIKEYSIIELKELCIIKAVTMLTIKSNTIKFIEIKVMKAKSKTVEIQIYDVQCLKEGNTVS